LRGVRVLDEIEKSVVRRALQDSQAVRISKFESNFRRKSLVQYLRCENLREAVPQFRALLNSDRPECTFQEADAGSFKEMVGEIFQVVVEQVRDYSLR
jgi:hypothetical protein